MFDSITDSMTCLGGASAVNQWRSTTLVIIRHEYDRACRDHASALTHQIVRHVEDIFGELVEGGVPQSCPRTLGAIVEQAVSLSRLLRVQRARFIVAIPSMHPRHQALFDNETMEDISGEDEQGLTGKELQCAVFPALYKFGDEEGNNTQIRNVIAKAQVFCVAD